MDSRHASVLSVLRGAGPAVPQRPDPAPVLSSDTSNITSSTASGSGPKAGLSRPVDSSTEFSRETNITKVCSVTESEEALGRDEEVKGKNFQLLCINMK